MKCCWKSQAHFGVPVRAVCYIMLFFSGFVSLVGGLDGSHTGYEIAKRSELEPVSFAVRFLPPDSTFAGWPTYNHPLLLCGCKMVEGYAGHLFSHGIDYEARDEELKAMMMGAPQWRAIANDLNVRYLFWGTRGKKKVTRLDPAVEEFARGGRRALGNDL